jgi:hypothetical protein
MIFGENVIVVGNQDIHGRFNSHYAGKLIIAIDESRIDKKFTLEKLKALSTQKTIIMEAKFQDARNLPFFGKFILCSNYEDNFINATDEDIRYWVRKLEKPKHVNYDIENNLLAEVPAFLHYLESYKLSTSKKSRMWFAPEDIETDALNAIRQQSRPGLYKDMKEMIAEYFLANEDLTVFFATPTDIKDRFFPNQRYDVNYIQRILKHDFKKESKNMRYVPFGEGLQKNGRAYLFERNEFLTEDIDDNIESC